MQDIPDNLKERAKRAAKEAATRAVTDAVIDQAKQIPTYLLTRAKAIKESGQMTEIPEHLMERAKAARERAAQEGHIAFGSIHFKEACEHGVTVRQCRCPGPKTTKVVGCPASCGAMNPLISNLEEATARQAERLLTNYEDLKKMLFKTCLALLANDVEIPKGVKEWFAENQDIMI